MRWMKPSPAKGETRASALAAALSDAINSRWRRSSVVILSLTRRYVVDARATSLGTIVTGWVRSAALSRNTTGNNNTAIGSGAGVSATGSDNIYVNHPGSSGESNTIRIGNGQRRAFIAGIRGVTPGVADAVPVRIDSRGQLGTVSSSRRFKDEIRDMGEASSGLQRLRPVTFRYKQAFADGARPLDYGLIAEEVAEVYPDLVTYGADGQLETVQYDKLITMLLNELQNQHRLIQDLTARFARLEALNREAGLLTAEAK